jgi:hypothetical protein
LRADDAAFEPTVARQPGDGAQVGGAAEHELVGHGDAAERDDVVDADQWEPFAAGLGVIDADRVVVEVEAGAGGQRVESVVDDVSHPRSPAVVVGQGRRWAR